eukprot:jgi/Mesen1/9468/ME000627S08850
MHSDCAEGTLGSPGIPELGGFHKFLPSNNEDEENWGEKGDVYASDEFRMYEYKVRRPGGEILGGIITVAQPVQTSGRVLADEETLVNTPMAFSSVGFILHVTGHSHAKMEEIADAGGSPQFPVSYWSIITNFDVGQAAVFASYVAISFT